jgi:hypothetical protein
MQLRGLLLIGILAAAIPSSAVPCSCVTDDRTLNAAVELAFRRSDVVAEVAVISVADTMEFEPESGIRWNQDTRSYVPYSRMVADAKRVAKVRVIRSWKGPRSGIHTVETAAEWEACGLGVATGQRLLLYAYLDRASSTLSTNSCSRSQMILDGATDIEVLDRLWLVQTPNKSWSGP